MEILLASASPRRRDLLREAGIPFAVHPVDVDETPPVGLGPRDAARCIARRKARAALPAAGGRTVLGADTLVVLEGRIIGKPDSDEDAARTLHQLSGRAHEVITGLCLIDPDSGTELRDDVVTRVTFRALSPEEILSYVGTGESRDKAGSYGIQGAAAAFVSSLRGSRDNVIGLPTVKVVELLARREVGS